MNSPEPILFDGDEREVKLLPELKLFLAELTQGRLARKTRILTINKNGCWELGLKLSKAGYSSIWFNGKIYRSHRLFYEKLIGPIPIGLVPDHLCRNRGCVNPSHLEPVTTAENNMRGLGPTKTHCKKGHEFSKENTHVTKKGWRICRKCCVVKTRKHKIKKRKNDGTVEN